VRRRRAVALGIVTCLVLAGGLAAWSATGASAAASYRTATATRGSVEQTLTATGTATPSSHADLSFGTTGTVKTVAVAPGDHVDIGDTLAVLDRTALRAAVTAAQADLARAKATLASDTAAQADAVSAANAAPASPTGGGSTGGGGSGGTGSGGSGSGGSGSGGSGSGGSTGSSAATARTLEKLAKEQAALVAAQHDVDAALQVSAAAASQQSAACAGVITSDPAATQPTDVTGCQQALGAAQAAQAAVSKAQETVEKAIETLSASLAAAMKTVSPSTTAPTSTSTRATFSTAAYATTTTASTAPAAGTSGGGPQGASSGTVTAATLARDQAAIDTAHAAVVRAKAARDQAQLRTPIAGTVAAVDVAPGDTASTSTVAVVVNGDDGNVEITIDVSEDNIGAIKVGQDARVSADGSTSELPARVTSVGLLAATDSGTATYPVGVSLTGAPLSLASGSDATVSVVTATVDDVVTVPSSAVTRTAAGSTGVVRLLVGDQLTTTRVEIGAVGPVLTEIRSGLKAGQRIVLADMSAALPSSSTGARFGGGGGFGGGPGGGPQGRVGGGPPVTVNRQ
jgi:HlyD family secretion protein